MKNMKLKIVALTAIVIAFFSAFVSAEQASNFLTLLATENSEYRMPQELIRIEVDEENLQHVVENYAIELDGVDVSAMIVIEGNQLTIDLVQEFSVDEHELRVVEYAEDGSINERAYWTFYVKASEQVRQYSYSADTQLITSYRVDDKNIGEFAPDRSQTNASSQLGFSTTKGDWYVQGQFDLNYTSVKENRFTDRTIENSDFSVSTGNQYATMTIGHQNIGSGSLVMDNFRRRGLSLGGKITQINSEFTGFALSSADITGFGQGLGVSDKESRVSGYTFQSNPFSDSQEKLNISGTWLVGQGNSSGGFISDLDNLLNGGEKGTAWALSADSFLFDSKLMLKAEYARSEYDFNLNDNLIADQDSAQRFSATYSDQTEAGMAWNAGMNYQKIGTFFKSIANEGLPSDIQLTRIFSNLQWETIALQLSSEQQQDNVKKISQLPTIESRLTSVMTSWSPLIENAGSWMGTASFSAGYNQQKQQQTYTPLGYIFPVANNELKSIQLGGQFSYETNSWSVTFMETQFVDISQVQSNTDIYSVDLSASLIFAETVNISPSIRFDKSNDQTTLVSATGVTYSLQGSMNMIPDKLDGSANLTINDSETSDLLSRGIDSSMNFSLIWHAKENAANSLGIDATLSASYNDIDDKIQAFNSLESYQVFLTVTLLLPIANEQQE